MVSGCVMKGSVDASAMTLMPLPPMAKLMTSATESTLALMIACRSDPAPLSLVLVTKNAAGAIRDSKGSMIMMWGGFPGPLDTPHGHSESEEEAAGAPDLRFTIADLRLSTAADGRGPNQQPSGTNQNKRRVPPSASRGV